MTHTQRELIIVCLAIGWAFLGRFQWRIVASNVWGDKKGQDLNHLVAISLC